MLSVPLPFPRRAQSGISLAPRRSQAKRRRQIPLAIARATSDGLNSGREPSRRQASSTDQAQSLSFRRFSTAGTVTIPKDHTQQFAFELTLVLEHLHNNERS